MPGRRRTADPRGAPLRTASGGSGGSGRSRHRRSPNGRRSQILPEGIAREPPDADVLADRRDLLGDQVADGALLVAERLVEQADLRVPLLQLALDDLLADVLRLLLDGIVAEQLGLLRLEIGGGDRVDVDVERAEARHLDRQVADELLELVGPGDEIRLAVDLDQDADPATRVDVARDEALAGIAARLLRGRGETALTKQGDGLVEVAVRLDERVLAVHEAGAGALAQLLDARGRDVRHVVRVLLCRFAAPAGGRGWGVVRLGVTGRAAPAGGRGGSAGGRLLLLGGFAGELRGDLLGCRLGRGRCGVDGGRGRAGARQQVVLVRVRLERQGRAAGE